jgi:hypothetical protein
MMAFRGEWNKAKVLDMGELAWFDTGGTKPREQKGEGSEGNPRGGEGGGGE